MRLRPSDDPARTRCAELVLPHLNSAYNLARWLSRNDADAEDIVQDALERALKYASALQGTNAKAWFLTIVRHACYDWIGRNRPAELARGDPDQAIDETPDPGPTPEETMIAEADAQALVMAIASLPVGFREVLLLREQEDMFVPRYRAHRRHTDRDGDVAARAGARPAATVRPAVARGASAIAAHGGEIGMKVPTTSWRR